MLSELIDAMVKTDGEYLYIRNVGSRLDTIDLQASPGLHDSIRLSSAAAW